MKQVFEYNYNHRECVYNIIIKHQKTRDKRQKSNTNLLAFDGRSVVRYKQ